jgi:RHS repeat-associated protein
MGVDTGLMAAASNPAGWVSGQMHSYLTYGLDGANNRTATGAQDAGGTATTDYDLQGGSHPQGPSNRYDAVGPLGGALTPYEYDGRGNLIRDGVFVFRYDYLNRLQEVWKIRVDGDDDTEQYALVQEGADEEARQEVKLEVPDLMQRLPREHMNPTFRARLRAQITGGVIRLRGTGQGGGGMPSFTTPAQADLHAVYAYDAYNRRIMGIVVGVDTQFHTWDGWRQVVQYSLDTAPNPDAAVPTKQFVWGSRLDELLSYRRKNGSTWENYFVLHGGQDTAAKLVNSSGTVVEQYEYDPYGKASVYVGSSTTAVAESSVGLPFLWKGVRLDSETGLLFMRNRYYSTGLGRFLSSDSVGVWGDWRNSGNEYAYAANGPLTLTDPYGTQGQLGSGAAQGWADQMVRAWSSGQELPELVRPNSGGVPAGTDCRGYNPDLHGAGRGEGYTCGGWSITPELVGTFLVMVAITVVEEACGVATAVVYTTVELVQGNYVAAAIEAAAALPGVPSPRAIRRAGRFLDQLDECRMVGRRIEKVDVKVTPVGTRPGDLPARGEPNSTDVVDRGGGKGTIRDYGPDGRATTDYDFGHDHGHGDPHAHDWDWSKPKPRQTGRPINPGE